MNFKIKAQASYADVQWTESLALENVVFFLQKINSNLVVFTNDK